VRVKFDVLLTGGEKGVFDAEAEALGARLFYVRFTRRTLPAFIREFRRILAQGNYHAIHDHQDYIAGLHFLLGAGRLPPIRIAHVHNPHYHRRNYGSDALKRGAMLAGRRAIGFEATHVMGTSRQIVSEYGFDRFADRGPILGVAHCGFDLARFRGDQAAIHLAMCHEFRWPESTQIVLFVGRLAGSPLKQNGQIMSHKNPDFALHVARMCIERNERVRFLMVGDGEAKRQDFIEQVRKWGLGQKIHLSGSRTDVPQLMLGSELLLFPSLAEGLGMVVVEAQAAGLRVLASDSTPSECVVVPELVDFLPLNEGEKFWAEKTLRLLDQPRPDAAAANVAVASSPFSIANSATRLLGLYRQLRA
jgi:glycosyltransferase involved in cell wall biosynthesis